MLTQRQADLLAFLRQREAAGELCPSFEEMSEAIGQASKSGVYRLIAALVERGFVVRLPNRARAIKVVRMFDLEDLSSVPTWGLIAEMNRREQRGVAA